MMTLNNPEQVAVDELMQAKMLCAIYSERQVAGDISSQTHGTISKRLEDEDQPTAIG